MLFLKEVDFRTPFFLWVLTMYSNSIISVKFDLANLELCETRSEDNIVKTITYSEVSNKRAGWYKRGGYYIGLFGHYIKNHVLFNKIFWKKSQINRRGGLFIRYLRVTIGSCKFFSQKGKGLLFRQ